MSMPKVLKDIRYIQDNQLTGKYYTPEITIDTTDSKTISVNPLPTTWSSLSTTEYTSGEYRIESNLAGSGANPLSNAFDGVASSGSMYSALVSSDLIVTISLPTAIKVTHFKTYIPDSPTLDYIQIRGSNDKNSWMLLYQYGSNKDTSLTERELTTKGYYKYYQFWITVDRVGSVNINDIQISRYTVETKRSNFYVPNIPNPLSDNQRILLNTSNFDNTGVTMSTFNSVDIDTNILPNRYYELVYKDYKYLAKEVV